MVSIYQIGEYTKKTPKEINPMGFVVFTQLVIKQSYFTSSKSLIICIISSNIIHLAEHSP
jgi:hypothetical protein